MYIIVMVTIGHVTHTHMQPGGGYWSNFFMLTNHGNLVPTRNQILIDAHFELPRGTINHTPNWPISWYCVIWLFVLPGLQVCPLIWLKFLRRNSKNLTMFWKKRCVCVCVCTDMTCACTSLKNASRTHIYTSQTTSSTPLLPNIM